MEKVTKIVTWDAKGERGGPIKGSQTVDVPENWEEFKTLPEEFQTELFRSAVTQYVTSKNNHFRENELAIAQRDTRKALKHWFFKVMPDSEHSLHSEKVLKLLEAKVSDASKKAISNFLDKVDPVKD